MDKLVRIALDAMGGDNAPAAPVEAAVKALSMTDRAFIYLVGQEEVIKKELEKKLIN